VSDPVIEVTGAKITGPAALPGITLVDVPWAVRLAFTVDGHPAAAIMFCDTEAAALLALDDPPYLLAYARAAYAAGLEEDGPIPSTRPEPPPYGPN
jgi:hypothetical protein